MQGTGYNPFMRWVNYWEPKLYPSGNFNNYKQDLLYELSNYSNLTPTVSVNWKFIGPKSMPQHLSGYPHNEQSSTGVGQIHYILFDPNDQTHQTIYACSGVGGVFKSIDGGNNWTNAGTDKGLTKTGVSSIAISGIYPDIWFLATGHAEGMPNGLFWSNSIGVYRTLDGGTNFDYIGLDNVVQMRKIIFVSDNLNKGHIFVVTSNGLYECENAYSSNPTWNNNGNPIIQGNFYDIEVSPILSDSTIYASGTEGTGIYKYDWASNQYTSLNLSNFPGSTERRISIEISVASPNYLFAVATTYRTSNSSLYRFDLQNINQPAFAMGALNIADLGEAGVGAERALGWAVSPIKNGNNLS